MNPKFIWKAVDVILNHLDAPLEVQEHLKQQYKVKWIARLYKSLFLPLSVLPGFYSSEVHSYLKSCAPS